MLSTYKFQHCLIYNYSNKLFMTLFILGLRMHTISNLIKHCSQMTISEVSLHLEIIYNFSKHRRWKLELTKNLSLLLILLKNILKDYDNSGINVITTNILNNVISKGLIYDKEQKEKSTISTLTQVTDIYFMFFIRDVSH